MQPANPGKIPQLVMFAALAALAAPPGAIAQDLPESPEPEIGILLETVTLSASSEAVGISQTGASVNVVTEEDLQRAGDLSLAGHLARLPGVSMTRNGGMGASTALRLRGMSGPYIGVRIDGIDVADPSGTQLAYDFGSTTTGGLSRIEVLRGSQSALYGSSAVGGVVDITTFRPETEGASGRIGIEGGSDRTWSGTAAAGYRGAQGEVGFSASRTITDGISTYAGGTEDDAFRATFLTFHAAYDLTDTLRLGANVFARDSYTEFDSQTADNAETEEGKLRGGRLYLQAETGPVSHEFSVSRSKTDRYYPLGWVTSYKGDRDQIAWNGRWAASGQVTLHWGLDQTDESSRSDGGSGDSRMRSVFGEMIWAVTGDLDLSLALRRDDHDVFGGKTSGRAAMAWRPTGDWVIRAVASTGFRAPSLYELYSPYGNLDLTPETSRNLELGAEYLLPGGGSLQATLFDTRIEDRVSFDSSSTACPSGWGCYAQTPGISRSRGIELTGQADLAAGWQVFGSYTYTDAFSRDAGIHTRLVRVPRHDLTLGLEGELADGWSMLASMQYVADVLDNGIWPAPVSPLGDYTVVNLGVSYQLNDATRAYMRVENLFDEDYQTVRNYGQPGRQVFAGVSTSF